MPENKKNRNLDFGLKKNNKKKISDGKSQKCKKCEEEKDYEKFDCCECSECAQCLEASRDPCDAPTANKELNVILTKLPRNLNFVLPSIAEGSIAAAFGTAAPITPNLVGGLEVGLGVPIDTVLAAFGPLPGPFPAPATAASLVSTILPLTTNMSLDQLFEIIFPDVAVTALENDPGIDDVDDAIVAAAKAFGFNNIARIAPVDYFINLPNQSKHEIEIEWPLRWIVAALITKIRQRLGQSGTPTTTIDGMTTTDPLSLASSGIVNIYLKLHINPKDNLIKDFADIAIIQNTDGITNLCNCQNTGDIVVDFNFYFFISGGVLVSGLVFFSNSKKEYVVLTINPTPSSTTGLKADDFFLAVPVISTGGTVLSTTATLPTYTITTSAGPITLPTFLQTILPAVTVVTIGFLPVFTPAILLSFTPSCDNDECKKSYVLVNESGFNL